MGNTTCYSYDALHRLTKVAYTGPYAANSPTKYFVYDAANVDGANMSNAKARMAEAYTCASTCGTKTTDVGLGYDALGRNSDVYQSSPNSAGYYHVTNTYYSNGVPKTLSNLVGLPSFTYGVDGEGRIYSASASSGQNPLTSVAYIDNASLATQISLGSTDTDSFTYDPNSNRLTGYSFKVNGQSLTGTLTWSDIGSLDKLVIADPFNSADSQTCNYTHDDLNRISTANCGSVWSQTFSPDAFGNIKKTGTISFQPTYNPLTNQMTEIGSSMPSYDPNGNVLSDTAHTYTWNANGRPVTIDSATLIFDALDRLVEQTSGGVTTQTVYTPAGAKLAIMSGQAIRKAFVPLVGNSLAVYTGSGLQYYRHADWLGTSRLASTTSRTVYFDGSYAPFGEPYAETGTSDLSFTGKNQDVVSNLYDFPAREYNPIHGRWPSPDPSGLSAVSLLNPQTLNRYAYANNDPVDDVDPLGLFVGACIPKVPKEKRNGLTEAQYLKELEMLGANMMTQVMLCEATKNLETGGFVTMALGSAFDPFAQMPANCGGPIPCEPDWNQYTTLSAVMGDNGLGIDMTGAFDPMTPGPGVRAASITSAPPSLFTPPVPWSVYPMAVDPSPWNAASSFNYSGAYSGTGAPPSPVAAYNFVQQMWWWDSILSLTQ